MAHLSELVAYCDRILNTLSIRDYAQALNGLQLESRSGVVHKIVAAVDASSAVIQEAAKDRHVLLLVHHGLFWQGAQPLRAGYFKKISTAIESEMAVYSSHLPLDVHSEFGNNVLLAKEIGMRNLTPFMESKGTAMGLQGGWSGSVDELRQILEKAVGGRVHVAQADARPIRRIGLVTGGAGSEIIAAAASGVDAFVTGEGPHWSYPLAQELGVHLLYAGHYATETFGVKAFGQHLAKTFGLDYAFIDSPTGL